MRRLYLVNVTIMIEEKKYALREKNKIFKSGIKLEMFKQNGTSIDIINV